MTRHEITLLEKILKEGRETSHELARLLHLGHDLLYELKYLLQPLTPTDVAFQEFTMLPPIAGNTLVYVFQPKPAGSQFSAGTSFNLVSSDTSVTPTVDATGMIVTIPLPASFVDDPSNPFHVDWTASGIVPNPSTAPTSLSKTITPSVAALTPTDGEFVQSV